MLIAAAVRSQQYAIIQHGRGRDSAWMPMLLRRATPALLGTCMMIRAHCRAAPPSSRTIRAQAKHRLHCSGSDSDSVSGRQKARPATLRRAVQRVSASTSVSLLVSTYKGLSPAVKGDAHLAFVAAVKALQLVIEATSFDLDELYSYAVSPRELTGLYAVLQDCLSAVLLASESDLSSGKRKTNLPPLWVTAVLLALADVRTRLKEQAATPDRDLQLCAPACAS